MSDEWNGPTGQSCKNCYFWISGSCYRYPPTVMVEQLLGYTQKHDGDLSFGAVLDTQIPDTENDLWCGEWKGRG